MIRVNAGHISSKLCGILITCLSVMLVRKIIIKFKPAKTITEEIIITMISYCTIYNFMYIEILYFAESCVMALGVFMALLAAYQFIEPCKHKVIKSFILLLIAVFSYNGTVGVYIVSVILILLLQNKNLKYFLKNIFIAIGLILTSIILNFIQIKLAQNYFNIVQNRLSFNIIYNLKFIIGNFVYVLLGETNQLYPKGLFLILLFLILGISMLYFGKSKIYNKNIVQLLFLTFFGMLSSFAIHIFSLSSFGAGRIHVSIGMLIGYIFIMLYVQSEILKNKNYISYSLICILYIYFFTNIINFYVLTMNHQIGNKIDKLKVKEISNYIEQYEEKTGIQIKYIAMKYFNNKEKGYYKKMNSINSLAIYSECSYDGIINFYTNRNLKKIDFTYDLNEKYIKETKGKDIYLCIDNILICPVYLV